MYVCKPNFRSTPMDFSAASDRGSLRTTAEIPGLTQKKNMIAMVYCNHESHLLNISVYESWLVDLLI